MYIYLAVLFLITGSAFQGEPGQKCVMRGKVTDSETKLPIANATIEYFDKNYKTQYVKSDSLGNYCINKFMRGYYYVEAKKPGYQHARGHVDSRYSEVPMADIALTPGSNIEVTRTSRHSVRYTDSVPFYGKVIDSYRNKPVENARITIVNMVNTIATDNKGVFSFGFVPKGRYEVSITANGFENPVFTLGMDNETRIDVELKRDSAETVNRKNSLLMIYISQ